MTKFIAHFQPEAWINDYAVPVDAPGKQEWDATEFLNNPPEWLKPSYCKSLKAEASENGYTTDDNDALREDPAAPEWIRDWYGPFTISIKVTP